MRKLATIGWLATALALLPANGVRAQGIANPHGQTRLTLDCQACHTTGGWRALRQPFDFDHSRQTRFVLTGRHAAVGCAGCHLDLRYDRPKFAAGDCASCHLDVHQGRLPGDCASCHNTSSFREAANLEQHARGRFPLTGAHVQISCESCHADDRGGAFTPLSGECVSCHRPDYQAARSIDHVKGGLPRECRQCHGTSSWQGATFDHAAAARGFALEGRHVAVTCAGCHAAGGGLSVPRPASSQDCVACHRADYDEEHRGSGFPVECAGCHTVDGWERGDFDHAASAHGFALLGKHRTVLCTECHTPPGSALKFQPANADDCVACHRAQYQEEHAGSGFPVTCRTCHTVDGWAGAQFDHVALGKGFALLGAHARATCTDCHTPPDNALRFARPAGEQDCLTCHKPDYDREHTGTGFPTTCLSCHDRNDWSHAAFDHATAAKGFALEGAHGQAACTTCHAADNTLKFPRPVNMEDCIACHRTEYDGQHTGSGFPLTCRSCHTVTNWATASFDHATLARGFTLEGAHAQAACSSCHGANNALRFPAPAGPNDCIACHQADYNTEHSGTGFPTTCLSCHTTSTFQGAVFDHGTTGFALQGAHVQATCATCHGANNVLRFPKPTGPNDCIACHQADYNREHTGSGYPTTCLTCHNNVTFTGATFDHDAQFFPINSGKHRGKWSQCQDCHPSAGNFATFTCLSCHEHSKQQMDDKHRGEPGYAYDSVKCLACHPRGTH
jgi:hypothetical protein